MTKGELQKLAKSWKKAELHEIVKVAYPNLEAESPVESEDFEFNATADRFEVDSDNWNG